MPLVAAYSLEYGQVIDAEMAYDLFWSGDIKNKSAFTCPHCSGKVTCANLDKAEQDLLQSPHFRSYGHDPGCEFDDKLAKSQLQVTEPVLTEFIEQRPQGMFRKQQANRDKPQRTKTENSATTGQYQPAYYTVRSLVSQYIKLRQSEQLESVEVKIAGAQQSYKKLFKGIYNQPLNRLPEDKTIYWGLAYVDKLKKSGDYRIKFVEAFRNEEKAINPSFFINHDLLDQYAVKSLLQTRLEKVISGKDKRAFVFIYSDKPQLAKSGDYINFKLDNLDHIEIRYLELFEQLRKK